MSGRGVGSDRLSVMVSHAVVGIMAAYGIRLSEAGRAAPGEPSVIALARQAGLEPPTVGALVTFTGPKVRGGLLLASTADLIGSTRPAVGRRSSAPESARESIMIRDWVSELANQVLGRLKNALRASSVSFDTHPATPLSAQAVAAALPKSSDTRPMLFRAGNAGVTVWLDVTWEEEVELRGGNDGRPSDGKLILL